MDSPENTIQLADVTVRFTKPNIAASSSLPADQQCDAFRAAVDKHSLNLDKLTGNPVFVPLSSEYMKIKEPGHGLTELDQTFIDVLQESDTPDRAEIVICSVRVEESGDGEIAAGLSIYDCNGNIASVVLMPYYDGLCQLFSDTDPQVEGTDEDADLSDLSGLEFAAPGSKVWIQLVSQHSWHCSFR